MTSKEAIKRLRQETAPATYMPDFDKEECLKIIEKELEELEQYRKVMIPPIRKLMKDLDRLEKLERYLVKWEEQLGIDGVNSKGMVRADIQFLLKKD